MLLQLGVYYVDSGYVDTWSPLKWLKLPIHFLSVSPEISHGECVCVCVWKILYGFQNGGVQYVKCECMCVHVCKLETITTCCHGSPKTMACENHFPLISHRQLKWMSRSITENDRGAEYYTQQGHNTYSSFNSHRFWSFQSTCLWEKGNRKSVLCHNLHGSFLKRCHHGVFCNSVAWRG